MRPYLVMLQDLIAHHGAEAIVQAAQRIPAGEMAPPEFIAHLAEELAGDDVDELASEPVVDRQQLGAKIASLRAHILNFEASGSPVPQELVDELAGLTQQLGGAHRERYPGPLHGHPHRGRSRRGHRPVRGRARGMPPAAQPRYRRLPDATPALMDRSDAPVRRGPGRDARRVVVGPGVDRDRLKDRLAVAGLFAVMAFLLWLVAIVFPEPPTLRDGGAPPDGYSDATETPTPPPVTMSPPSTIHPQGG